MSRQGPRGREGPNELWRFGWGSRSITEPTYDGSMSRNSLEAVTRTRHQGRSPLRWTRAESYIARTVVSFLKTAEA